MSSSAIDRACMKAVKRVARAAGGSYFYRSQVRAEVYRSDNIGPSIAEIRRSYRALALDDAVIRYIDIAIGRALQAKDDRGLRIYECYSVGHGERRWYRLLDMHLLDIRRLLRDAKSMKAHLEDRIALYELVAEEMERLGPEATVAEVYDSVVDQVYGLTA